MTKNQNVIYWAIGIILFLLVVTQLPIVPLFAIITKTVCVENTISYWDLDGNILDAQGINNGDGYNISFIFGKLGQAVKFNGTSDSYINFPSISAGDTVMWVRDYSINDPDYYFIANLNGTNYVNGVQSDARQIIPLGSNFGAGFNGSVDEIAIFTSLSVSDMLSIYNEGIGTPICYTTTSEENVTCKNYATEQATPQTTGCLEYSGDLFPNCTYDWLTTSGFYASGNECLKRFYCADILTSDFNNLELCQSELNITTITNITEEEEAAITTIPPSLPSATIGETLDEDLFRIGNFGIKLWYLLALIAAVLILFFTGAFGKK